jgi:hypothetical protein
MRPLQIKRVFFVHQRVSLSGEKGVQMVTRFGAIPTGVPFCMHGDTSTVRRGNRSKCGSADGGLSHGVANRHAHVCVCAQRDDKGVRRQAAGNTPELDSPLDRDSGFGSAAGIRPLGHSSLRAVAARGSLISSRLYLAQGDRQSGRRDDGEQAKEYSSGLGG